MSSGEGLTPRGTVIGDGVLVALLRSHPYDSVNITGGSPFNTCIQVQACRCSCLTFSVNDSVVGGSVGRLLMDFDDFPTLFFHTFCHVSDIFLLSGYAGKERFWAR